jgi:hypothetical protein
MKKKINVVKRTTLVPVLFILTFDNLLLNFGAKLIEG